VAFVDVAAFKDLQRRDQLRARELGAPLVGISERGQRAHDVAHHLVVLEDFAVVRFHRPDGQHDVTVDAEARLDAVERRLVFPGHGAADLDRVLVHAVVEIIPHRGGEFRLEAGFFQHFGIDVGDAAESAVVGRARYAAFGRRLAEDRYPALEPGIRERRRQQHAEAEHGRCRGADQAPDANIETHLFPPSKDQEDDSSLMPVMNWFTMLPVGNENAGNALFGGHENVTKFPVGVNSGMKMS
jgi:hypothetical protein